jgi:AcrR family transcriptional regulator
MTKHRSADERYAQILKAAKACFLERGYFATRVDQIAKKAGLSKGGVYFHFKSKREIFMALVDEEYSRAMGAIDSVTMGEGDALSKLLTLAEHFTRVFEAGDEPKFLIVIGEMALRDPEVRGQLLTVQQSYIDKIAELVEWGVREGHLREGLDAPTVALLLKAQLDGIQVAFAAGTPMELERVLPAALDMFMRALGASPQG